jgi:hypothetical protein
MKIKEWNTSKEIAEICNINERTIERKRIKMIKDNINIHWFKTKKKPFKYKFDFISEFLSNDIFKLIKRIKQLETTIDCLKRKDTIEQHLSLFPWDYFITIAYEQSINKKHCFTEMSKLYEKINSTSIDTKRMFFVTEPFNNRTGYHNHFIIKSSLNKDELTKLINSQLPKGILDIKPYDPHLAGFFYICKKGVKGEDWDILGNRLKDEAEEIF